MKYCQWLHNIPETIGRCAVQYGLMSLSERASVSVSVDTGSVSYKMSWVRFPTSNSTSYLQLYMS